MSSLTNFLRINLPKLLSGESTIERWRNKYTFIIAAQNANTGSVWAKLVRQGQLKPEDVVWFFRVDRAGNRKWIACFFRRTKQIHIWDRSWFNWFKRNLPPKNGWRYLHTRPRIESAGAPLLEKK